MWQFAVVKKGIFFNRIKIHEMIILAAFYFRTSVV